MRTLGHNPDYWRVGASNCKTWSVGFLPLFMLFYLIFWNLSRYYAARAVAPFSSELRAASEKVQWRRYCPRLSWSHSTVFQKKNYETARSVNRHCLKLTDNAILYWWLNLFERVVSSRVRARANIFIGACVYLFCRLCIILGVLVKTWIS